MSDMIGRTFNERYKIIEKVGTGGMAEVYRATDIILGRTVAVKVMLPQYAGDGEFTQRFRQEAASAANLNSPYIVNIYDWGQDQGTYYIVMEYVRGSDLKSGIKARGAINQRKAAEIGMQVCQALNVAHNQDIIHRDIKPQNIMVQPDGNIKVMDFGIARAKNSTVEEDGSVLGTAHYISPEQAQGKELAATTDLYSLGVVLYECVTGKVPFDGPDAVSVALQQVTGEPVHPRQLNPNVDPNLESIIMRAMAKDPAKRYQTAADLRDALQAFLAGTPISPSGTPMAADAAATVALSPAAAASFAAASGRGASGTMAPDRTALLGEQYMEDLAAGAAALNAAQSGRLPRGASVSDAQAAARARIAARNYQAAIGAAGRLGADGTDRVRNVSAYDPQYNGMGKSKLGIIIGAIAVVLAIIIGLVVSQCGGSMGSPDTVPNVVGKTQVEAQKIIRSNGFAVGEVTEEFSDTVEKGHVISVSPEIGTKVEPGSSIDLVVSKGKELVKVPVLTGKTVTEVQQLLAEAGLVGKAGEATYSSTVDTNLVISQEPVAGAKIEKGSTVIYVLSLGAKTVAVPSVTGKTVSEARSILSKAGFTVIEQHEYSSTVDKDTVISQSPAGSSKIDEGGSVTIVVSDGMEMVEVPNVVGLTMKQAVAKLLAAGLSVRKAGNTDDSAEVISQSPAASTGEKDMVERQTLITITGKPDPKPDPEPEPEPEPEPQPDPEPEPGQGGDGEGGTA